MNPFLLVYNELLFRPLYNLLAGIVNVLPSHNVAIAIIIVTLIVRLILLPSSIHQVRQAQKNQAKMGEVQGRIKKIQKKHKNDRTKQAEETMKVYREVGLNPASGCLPLIIQLPILIAMYRVFLVGINEDTWHFLYSFVASPRSINLVFLGIPLEEPSLLLGVIAGIGQFVLMRFFTPAPQAQPGANESSAQMMASMQRNMMYFFPVMTIFIALQLPAALAFYWVASTLFAIIQQYLMKRVFKTTANIPIA